MRLPRLRLLYVVTAMLAACGPSANDPAAQPSATPSHAASPADDGLAPIAAGDIAAAHLPGELACAFTDRRGRMLLMARGEVASQQPAQAIVRIGNAVLPLAAHGGFDAMVKRAAFSGTGLTIDITSRDPVAGSGESPPRPATLSLHRAGAAPATLDGDWTCGP